MPVTLADVKERILRKVGDVDPATGEPPATGVAGAAAAVFDSAWAQHAAKDYISPGLRALYTMRECLDVVIGALSPQVDVALNGGEVNTRYSQRVATRVQQRAAVQAEIERLEEQAAAGREPGIGQLEQTAPIMPKDGWRVPLVVDPNDPGLSGSPYRPFRRTRW